MVARQGGGEGWGTGRVVHRMRENGVTWRSLFKVIKRRDGLVREGQLEQRHHWPTLLRLVHTCRHIANIVCRLLQNKSNMI